MIIGHHSPYLNCLRTIVEEGVAEPFSSSIDDDYPEGKGNRKRSKVRNENEPYEQRYEKEREEGGREADDSDRDINASTSVLCSKVIVDQAGLGRRFTSPGRSHQADKRVQRCKTTSVSRRCGSEAHIHARPNVCILKSALRRYICK